MASTYLRAGESVASKHPSPPRLHLRISPTAAPVSPDQARASRVQPLACSGFIPRHAPTVEPLLPRVPLPSPSLPVGHFSGVQRLRSNSSRVQAPSRRSTLRQIHLQPPPEASPRPLPVVICSRPPGALELHVTKLPIPISLSPSLATFSLSLHSSSYPSSRAPSRELQGTFHAERLPTSRHFLCCKLHSQPSSSLNDHWTSQQASLSAASDPITASFTAALGLSRPCPRLQQEPQDRVSIPVSREWYQADSASSLIPGACS